MHFDPDIEGLGVCAVKLGFDDDDAGCKLADETFLLIDEESATALVKGQIIQLKNMLGDNNEPQ